MTNEEKAKELANEMIICNQTNIEADVATRYVVDACMKMADWKDEKYQSEIDDLLKRLHEAEERERIARKIINEKNNELNELRK